MKIGCALPPGYTNCIKICASKLSWHMGAQCPRGLRNSLKSARVALLLSIKLRSPFPIPSPQKADCALRRTVFDLNGGKAVSVAAGNGGEEKARDNWKKQKQLKTI